MMELGHSGGSSIFDDGNTVTLRFDTYAPKIFFPIYAFEVFFGFANSSNFSVTQFSGSSVEVQGL